MPSHVRSVFGVQIFKNRHQEIKRIKKLNRAPKLYGHQVWQSCYALMDYLEKNPLMPNTHVMDIGCGWGVLGVYCASRFASNVSMVDADKRVFPYVEGHGRLNNVEVETIHAQFDQLTDLQLQRQDIIIGSDVCFWPSLATQLKLLIRSAMAAKVKRFILADPGRSTFMQLADYCQSRYPTSLIPTMIGERSKSKGYLLVIDNVV